MTALVLVSLTLLVALSCISAAGYELVSAARVSSQTFDPIPRTLNEKVLVDDRGFYVPTLGVLVMASHGQTVEAIRKDVEHRWGVASSDSRMASETYSAGPAASEEYKATVAEERRRLRALNINLEGVHVTDLTSRSYNVIDATARSVLFIRILDGFDMFRVRCTLIILHRTDHYRDWIRPGHGGIPFPLPIRADTTSAIVTSTELTLLQTLESTWNIHPRLKFRVYTFPRTLAGQVTQLEEVRRELDRAP
jgi:hypothetical protein